MFGISSRLRFDHAYRWFCELLTSQVATAIASANRHEEERKKSEALAEIDRAKTAFFSNVSHEFRTPLTLILGPLEALARRAEGSVTVSGQDLDLIRRNTLRLLKLVNMLLDFSRIEAGGVQAVAAWQFLAAPGGAEEVQVVSVSHIVSVETLSPAQR